MLFHRHRAFPSDVNLVFAAAAASLTIVDLSGAVRDISMTEFWDLPDATTRSALMEQKMISWYQRSLNGGYGFSSSHLNSWRRGGGLTLACVLCGVQPVCDPVGDLHGPPSSAPRDTSTQGRGTPRHFSPFPHPL